LALAPVKAPFHVAEQRRLDERRRDRRAVQRQIRPSGARREAVQAGRGELLAAARLALDQHRVGRSGELRDLALQLRQRRARADQLAFLGGRHLERARERALEQRRVARLGDELPGAERPRVARVGGVVLSREDEDLHARRVREQVGDQLEALVGRMRRRRQAEVDQRERRRRGQLAQQLDRVRARVAGVDLVVGAEREGERVGDQRVVIDDQQRPVFPSGLSLRRDHGCIS
jgi:hypothetical protein